MRAGAVGGEVKPVAATAARFRGLLRRGESSVDTLGVDETSTPQRRETPMEGTVSLQFVGIDLHRRRSVIVRMNTEGQVLGIDQVLNDPVELSTAVAKAGPDPRVPPAHWSCGSQRSPAFP